MGMEVVNACLATYLPVPVPRSYLVDLPPALLDVVGDAGLASRIRASSSVGFGSALVPGPLGVWHGGRTVSKTVLPSALGAFVFDAVIENVDRRSENPNCLVTGEEIWMIDHELAFPRNLIERRALPWEVGGLQWLTDPGRHIFLEQLRKHARRLDFRPVRSAWAALSDQCLDGIRAEIPQEWSESLPAVDQALVRVRQARDNINGVIAEARRVLT